MSEIYFSGDIESNGPIPGTYSMLSFAAVAYNDSGEELGCFSRNLDLLPGAKVHPKTQLFWNDNKEAYNATRVNTVNPTLAMIDFRNWIESFQGSPVYVAYPAGFDFTFIYWYFMNFLDYCPFSHSALDIKTLAMSLMGTDYRQSTKRNFPRKWFSKLPHTHVAEDDAREQGELFCNMWIRPNLKEYGN